MSTKGFNSRSREGATWTSVESGLETKVSIHAPVRERLLSSGFLYFRAVSIHAPVRERPGPSSAVRPPARFNSRSREGATMQWTTGGLQCAWFQFTLP